MPARLVEASRAAPLVPGTLVLCACFIAIYATPSGSYWIADCGNKALLSQRLLETRYRDLNFHYPLADLDPRGSLFPMNGGFAIRRADGFTSRFPPAYSAVAAPLLGGWGPPGLRFPAAFGTGVCAMLLAAWLAPVAGTRWAAGGGLALGLATPLFFYGVTVWEHSPTVALCLGAWIALARISPGRLLAAGALVGVGVWFREEIALMGMALAAASYVRERRLAVPILLAVGALPPVALLAVFNSRAYGDLLGPHLMGTENLEVLGVAAAVGAAGLAMGHLILKRMSRAAVAWVVLGLPVAALAAALWLGAVRPLGDLAPVEFQRPELVRQVASIASGYGATAEVATLLGLALLAAIVLGALATHGRLELAALLLACAIGLGSWGFGLFQTLTAVLPLEQLVLYNGLAIQLPMTCLAGIGLSRMRSRPEYEGLRIGVTAGLLFMVLAALLAVAAQRGIFGVHWGPRWLLPGVPALVVLAIAGLREDQRTSRVRRVVWTLFVCAGLVSSAVATWFLNQQKREAGRLENTILSQPARVAITPHPLLAESLPSLWEPRPMLWVIHEGALSRALEALRTSKIREFLMLVPGSDDSGGQQIEEWRCPIVARHRGRHLHYFDMDVRLCRSHDPRGASPSESAPRHPQGSSRFSADP